MFDKKIKSILVVMMLTAFAVSFGQAEEGVRVAPQDTRQVQLSFAPLVKKASPAVVNIYAERRVEARSPFAGDPFFDQFFGRRNRPSRMQSSLGSGVIIDPSGLVVTNYHVIRDAQDIKIVLADGREWSGYVSLQDEATDIAIIQILESGVSFPALELGDSDEVEVGDLVLAIGNPFGVGQTVTSGIVSAQARTRVGISDNDFFIQTDAAINPGNSGGALVGMDGALIGINTAIYSRSGGSVGIGFAIPSNLVRAVVETVRRGESHFEQPYLGASFQTITPEVAAGLEMKLPLGALVTNVAMGSPAAKAGIEVGDVILKADDVEIENPDALGYRLLTTGIGKTVNLEILRGYDHLETQVTLIGVPDEVRGNPVWIDDGNSPFLVAELVDLTDYNSRSFRLPVATRGVVIRNIEAGTKAAAYFQTGDIIRVVNGVAVNKVADLQRVLNGGSVRFWQVEYERGGVRIRQFMR